MSQTESKTLYSYHSDQNLTLEEAITNCQEVLESAIALLYSPQSCQFLRLTYQKIQYPNGEEKEAHELSDIFEARIFNKQCELRWLNQNCGKGKAVLLSKSEQSIADFIAFKPIQYEELREQHYLLWGQKVKNRNNQKGWQTLSEARIGKIDIPLDQSLQEKQRVSLKTYEYIDQVDDYGNVAVIEERLVELKPKPLEVKK